MTTPVIPSSCHGVEVPLCTTVLMARDQEFLKEGIEILWPMFSREERAVVQREKQEVRSRAGGRGCGCDVVVALGDAQHVSSVPWLP